MSIKPIAMTVFRCLFAIAFILLGGYWLYSILPIPWTEIQASVSYNKSQSQKSPLYSAFFALAIIAYGVYEIKNVFQKNS